MKRYNPKTGKFFKKGDQRDDGYFFREYQNRKNKDGFFRESWVKSIEKGKKRINPHSKNIFKQGDKRPKNDPQDDKIFWCYTSNPKNNKGLMGERWVTQKKFNDLILQQKELKKIYHQEFIKKRYPKRKKSSGDNYTFGDFENGRWFIQYLNYNNKSTGFLLERWVNTKDALIRAFIAKSIGQAKKRARKKHLDFNITNEYLLDIFPQDLICPVLKIKMQIGSNGGKENTPSIDRTNNSKGYVKGNIKWISTKANILKSSLSKKDVELLNLYFSKIKQS
ncbi:MAG: hypothetical protein CMD57_04985 [Gammaproteobacteria bacterium]|nr:hypothetical protein [Gammaproteobacteria bacterium]|tara:strand:- start:94 stop:930 length:837 start_codon:yes stop_codon:yes gene_type:complete